MPHTSRGNRPGLPIDEVSAITCGFSAHRKIERCAAIRSARFVVADLTHDNNGAYFEAGFAEGLGVPVIYTCEAQKFKEKKTHFDTNHMHTVPWDITNLDEAGRLLTATIRNTLPADAKLAD